MIKYLIQDWNANFSSSKGRFIMLNYRIASYINKRKFLKLIFFPYLILHRIFFDWILGVEININAQIGSGFKLFHGQGLVINGDSIVGNNCLFRNGITLGTKLNQNGVHLVLHDRSLSADSKCYRNPQREVPAQE